MEDLSPALGKLRAALSPEQERVILKNLMKQKLKFPEGFLWGASTSSYQIEGGIDNNDWAISKKVPRAGKACDSYNRYREDFSMAKYLHHNAHRMSVEWARIEPKKGQFNEDALHRYHEMLQYLKDQGLKTFLTLHHFTNPIWFAEQGGWKNKRAVEDFADYTAKVTQSLGHLVDFWITVNEPKMYAGMAFAQGIWPPFEKGIISPKRVYDLMLEAHNEAYDVIHSYYPQAQVGFSQNIAWSEAEHKDIIDRLAIKFADWLSYLALDKTRYDFIGLNHYMYYRVHLAFNLRKYLHIGRGDKLTERGWAIHPDALYLVLMKLKGYQKPIYITENGIADSTDRYREQYIRDYLLAVHRAIGDGADVRGYLHWSLLDNFEWEDGYKWKFGLIKVDFKTLARTIRESAYSYSHICQDNALTV